MEENHVGIVFGLLGFIGVVGSIISITFGKLISTIKGDMKTKVTAQHCNDIHKVIDDKLTSIEKQTEKTSDKLDGMDRTLVRIETILQVKSDTDTSRYDRHTEKYKNE